VGGAAGALRPESTTRSHPETGGLKTTEEFT
jgi:hypothetical protein